MLLRVVPNRLPTENQQNNENVNFLYLLDLIISTAVYLYNSYIFLEEIGSFANFFPKFLP